MPNLKHHLPPWQHQGFLSLGNNLAQSNFHRKRTTIQVSVSNPYRFAFSPDCPSSAATSLGSPHRLASSSVSPHPSLKALTKIQKRPAAPPLAPVLKSASPPDSFNGRISTHFELIPSSSLCIAHGVVKLPKHRKPFELQHCPKR